MRIISKAFGVLVVSLALTVASASVFAGDSSDEVKAPAPPSGLVISQHLDQKGVLENKSSKDIIDTRFGTRKETRLAGDSEWRYVPVRRFVNYFIVWG